MFYNINMLIKNSILYNRKFFRANLNSTELLYVRILIKLNIIKWVKKNTTNNKNQFLIYLSKYDNKPLFSTIVNMYKPSKPVYINWNNLKKTIYNKNTLIILSTNKGFMTSFEAYNSHTGGRIISKIIF